MSADNAFVDPSSLSLPSPQSSDVLDSPTPTTQTLASDAGPSRKRARTEMTTEERKEARAHRNRIAAQNSRDKRKAQYSALEQRVAELEEENRQLRAGMGVSELQRADDRRREELERERARERENAELKERIKSLEKGWEDVMKVLTAQGLSTGVIASSTTQPPPSPPSSNSPTTFPVFVPTSPVVFPLTPSPSLSAKSVFSSPDASNLSELESTRHLARVANAAVPPPAVSLQRVDSSKFLDKLHPLLLARMRQASRSHLRSRQGIRRRLRTTQPWTHGSVKSSRLHPQFRRRLCMLLSSLQKRQLQPPRPPPPGRR
ncbi:hypothetical protein SCHPADRAFT_736701 [Schizopora paradoxa]|uniref:X-box-binding protein 1 n=1 Tax=Schizopora paradoxa TaxID=27342 RepID=A0A0H2R012_9AGAM|nr:hypothetical protein SCHPADRAFT_736701 [Schizopora paradoxa]